MNYLTEDQYAKLSGLLNDRFNLMEYHRLTKNHKRTLAQAIERNRQYVADKKAIDDKINNLFEKAIDDKIDNLFEEAR